jgi:hypothetical protein
MLRGAREAGVERVHVHLVVVGHVAADHRALEEVDVLEVLGEPRGVVEIARRGFAVVAADRVDDMDRRARGAEMHPGA